MHWTDSSKNRKGTIMPIYEIRVSEDFSDPRGHEVERQAKSSGVYVEVESNRVFYIEGVGEDEAQALAQELLADPNTQSYSLLPRTNWDDQHYVEASPLPGTTNTEKDSLQLGAALLGIYPTAEESGTDYRFSRGTSLDAIEAVVQTILVNTTVEQVRTQAPETLIAGGRGGVIEVISVGTMSDEELMELSSTRSLALNPAEMQAIRLEAQRLNRGFYDAEPEYLGAAWSEHCCHKTMNAHIMTHDGLKPSGFKRIKENSVPYFEDRGVLSAFNDNSGVFQFYDGYAINIKLETHNSPRNLEPRGGAATGTGGVLRDINETGKGSRPINSMHMDFVAPPDMAEADLPIGVLTPHQLLTGSVRGVGGYGNPLGVPTNNGSFHVHPNYRGKSSILVGSMGIMHEKDAEQGIPLAGDIVVAVGGHTGRDGIHGATFSSESADAQTATVHSGAVQIGDPITEKKMFDAILEAGEKGLIRAMTDCGAAGFASAIGELGEDIGVRVDLARAPLKYTGLQPWEIFLSESQERAVLAIDPENLSAVEEIFLKHGSEATALGVFGTPNGQKPKLEVMYDGRPVIDLEYEFIKNGRGTETLRAEWIPPDIQETAPLNADWTDMVEAVLSDWNVCSKEPIVRRYDHEVQGSSAMKSYGGVHGDAPNNAAIMTPILGKPYAVIQAHGCNPALTDLDPDKGSVWSYTEAMSNFVAVGGNPDDALIVNNYISATPTDRVMGAIDMSVDALTRCVHEFESPIISGKDSLSSTYKNGDEVIESPYNLIITVAGKIPDVEKTVSTDVKKPGSTLVMIGKPDYTALGGSVYHDQFEGKSARVPEVDLPTFHQTAKALYEAIQTGEVWSSHDVSEGGLAVTVSEMLFGGDCGADLTFENNEHILPEIFFNETAGCFVVEVADEEVAKKLFGNVPHQVIGKTTEQKYLKVTHNDEVMPAIDIDQLKARWKQPLQEVFA